MSDRRVSGETASADESAFVARVARVLRAPEGAAPDFEARLMAGVRAEAPALYPKAAGRRRPAARRQGGAGDGRGWWRRPRELRISPLAGLALAAGFSGVICLGTLGVSTLGHTGVESVAARAEPGPATHDTVTVVRFVFVDRLAKNVALVGDFNAWADRATPLAAAGVDGVWAVAVPLRPGRHEYAFIVDGHRWVADPYAPKTTDDFSTESSVVTVGGSGNESI